ncbi:hypothetical protein [Cetobacterium somerae]
MGDKFNVNIKVMGIGGGGINALDEIVSSHIDDVTFLHSILIYKI